MDLIDFFGGKAWTTAARGRERAPEEEGATAERKRRRWEVRIRVWDPREGRLGFSSGVRSMGPTVERSISEGRWIGRPEGVKGTTGRKAAVGSM